MKLIISFVIISLLIIQGCTTPAYITNTPHAPLFKKAGEITGGINIGLPLYSAKAAFSFHDHFFLFGSSAFKSRDTTGYFKGPFAEGGIGYYNFLDDPFEIPFVIKINHLEILAGYGNGNSFGDFNGIDTSTVKIPAKYRRYFIQVNIGSSISKENERFNFTSERGYGQIIRLSFVDFYKFRYNDKLINKHFDNLFLEYFFFSRFGIDIIKLESSAGIVLPIQDNSEFGGLIFFISVGASLNFSL